MQAEDDRMLLECPTGYLMREAPDVWSTIEAAGMMENASPDELGRISARLHFASRLVISERARLAELRRSKEQGAGDAQYGARLRGR